MTALAFSMVVGKASIHLVKVSIQNKRYLNFLIFGMCEKSICQSWDGVNPQAW